MAGKPSTDSLNRCIALTQNKTFKMFTKVVCNMCGCWAVVVLLALMVWHQQPAWAETDGCMDMGTNIMCHQLCNVEVAGTKSSAVIVTGGVLDFRCPISPKVKVGACYRSYK
jgi:hypothetical protein